MPTINTIIFLRWKLTGRIEHFANLNSVYKYYDDGELGVSIYTLYKKNLKEGYQNDTIQIMKCELKYF